MRLTLIFSAINPMFNILGRWWETSRLRGCINVREAINPNEISGVSETSDYLVINIIRNSDSRY